MIVSQPSRDLLAAIDAALFCAGAPAMWERWRTWCAANGITPPPPFAPDVPPPGPAPRLPDVSGLRPFQGEAQPGRPRTRKQLKDAERIAQRWRPIGGREAA